MSFTKTLVDMALMRKKPLREQVEVPYASFEKRLIATVIDFILSAPLLYLAGMAVAWNTDKIALMQEAMQHQNPAILAFMIKQWLVQAAVAIPMVVLFWYYYEGTPGKLLLRMKIVDAATGGRPTRKQCIKRAFGMLLSAIVLFLGFLWIMIDKKRQSWHDKIAGTVVVNVRKEPKASPSA